MKVGTTTYDIETGVVYTRNIDNGPELRRFIKAVGTDLVPDGHRLYGRDAVAYRTVSETTIGPVRYCSVSWFNSWGEHAFVDEAWTERSKRVLGLK